MSSFTQGIEYSISVILATAMYGLKLYSMSLRICHDTLNRFKGIAQLQHVRNAYKLSGRRLRLQTGAIMDSILV